MTEEEIDALEEKFPQMALAALREASARAAESGLPRVLVIGDDLVRIQPNGEREFIRTIQGRERIVRPAEEAK
ncbi:MAG: hypothetical protein K2W96_21085 [Gemmataceae bacterium]|nr:hypothetical protein [Gemmataceae bacterium]